MVIISNPNLSEEKNRNKNHKLLQGYTRRQRIQPDTSKARR